MYGVCHELQLLQKRRAACSLSLKIPHYKKRDGGNSLLSFPLIDKRLVFLLFGPVFLCAMASQQHLQPVMTQPHPYRLVHTSLCWPVSNVITGRLLHAFMKYLNGSMGGGWGETMTSKEHLICWKHHYFISFLHIIIENPTTDLIPNNLVSQGRRKWVNKNRNKWVNVD